MKLQFTYHIWAADFASNEPLPEWMTTKLLENGELKVVQTLMYNQDTTTVTIDDVHLPLAEMISDSLVSIVVID